MDPYASNLRGMYIACRKHSGAQLKTGENRSHTIFSAKRFMSLVPPWCQMRMRGVFHVFDTDRRL